MTVRCYKLHAHCYIGIFRKWVLTTDKWKPMTAICLFHN